MAHKANTSHLQCWQPNMGAGSCQADPFLNQLPTYSFGK